MKARALANRPPVILTDEPTAPLDSERGLAVMRILHQLASQYQTAIIVVTHDEKIIHDERLPRRPRAGQRPAAADAGGPDLVVTLTAVAVTTFYFAQSAERTRGT